MNRRWQADGISFWRKLSSSNWWWYGEVNPAPASLPSPENRPKFWRGAAVAWTIMLFGVPTLFFVSEEINSRHWPFSHTTTHVGRIVATNYRHPQLEVELEDKTVVSMAFPMQDGFGVLNKNLPIHFIVEDNRKSVCTDTRKAWSKNKLTYENISDKFITYYRYKLKYPHAGAGQRVQF